MGNQESPVGPAGEDAGGRGGGVFYSHLSTSLLSELGQFGLSMEKNFLSIELVFPDTILCPPMG